MIRGYLDRMFRRRDLMLRLQVTRDQTAQTDVMASPKTSDAPSKTEDSTNAAPAKLGD